VDANVERYLRLGLQIGRHVEGVVDSYYGPRELAEEVDAAPPADPRMLLADSEALLEELDDGWLRDQVAGICTYASVLAGEPIPYADEVEGCFGVRPTHTDESVFLAAHEELEELLPGDGPVSDRNRRWEESIYVAADRVRHALSAVIEEARTQTRELVELPDGEDVELEIVNDVPWLAYCGYRGGLRSRIEVNADLPQTAIKLLHLAIHETYAGHHTEACMKEQVLVRDRGLLEQTLALVPTPQALVAEGIAELAPALLLDGEGGLRLAALTGVDFDLAHARAIDRATEPCEWAVVNAALMLHEDEATTEETQAYLERWGLLAPRRAAHAVRFLQAPASRSYVMNYPAGRALCRAYVAGDVARFRTLLTEQVRVGELLAAAP
jgi:hypothetical protein